MSNAFTLFDPAIQRNITFRQVSMDKDLHRLHRWMNETHVIPFWQLNMPLWQYKQHLETALSDHHQTLYIGELDGVPMSYWESYWAAQDIIRGFYPAGNDDQGTHLLIGNPHYIGKGYSLPLLRAMTAFQFKWKQTHKVVSEPDIHNKKMIHIFQKCGFEPIQEIELPDKKALLMVCDRHSFYRRWQHVLGTTNL
ncbi:GNAT family N-acetyltransferase [Tuberibacillus sp. Marseille-P3662]|uniref:GNAT family N-acetyltransferase n=1 Tax=Tuberibacillus sp. Marseille-P3662 TaxID=1965358 RepID=UPI000A1C87A8|nr:GNAT family N-acetyltransferase [Tuberibacillus sp. Marseille-P3662]